MHLLKSPVAVAILASVALAGCTGGGDALGMKITESDDPITLPYLFKASGSADRFVWDFGDGSPTVEGKEVEHLFGFTDGEVDVRLTAHKGEKVDSVTRTLMFGTGQNVNPSGALQMSSDWVAPGGDIVLSGAATSDPDGDPLLYRWNCRALGAPTAAVNDGHVHSTGGVPFGYQFAASVVGSGLPSADRAATGDLCDALQDTAWSRDATVSGSFAAVGVYDITLEVRDPKSNALKGYGQVFVTDGIPDPVVNLTFEGSFVLGTDGTISGTGGDDAGPLGDIITHPFTVDVPNKLVTIRFDQGSDTVAIAPTLEYEILSGNTVIVPATSEPQVLLAAGTLKNGPEYAVRVTAGTQSIAASYTVDMTIQQDLKWYHLWEAPVA